MAETEYKTRDDLLREIEQLKARLAAFEQTEAGHDQVRSALEDSQLRYRALFDYALDAVILENANEQILDANPAACRMLGYTLDELRSMTSRQLEEPERQHLSPHPIYARGADDPEGGTRFQTNLVRRDGTVFPADITITPLPLRDQTIFMAIMRDISERQQAEEALAAERNLLRTLIDLLPDYIYLKDQDGRYVLQNRAALDLINVRTMDEVVGKTPADFYPPELAEQFAATDRIVLDEGQPIVNVEQQLVDAKGNVRTIITTKVPICNGGDAISGLVGIGHDITERKRIEDALAHYAKRLDVLHTLDQGVLSGLPAEEIAGEVLQGFCRLVPCPSASMALFDPDTDDALIVVIGDHGDTVLSAGDHTPLSEFGIPDHLKRHRKRIIADLATVESPSRLQQVLLEYGMRSYLSAPLIVEDHLIGELALGADEPGAFGPAHRVIATQLADQLAIGMSHIRLREKVQRHNEELRRRVAQRTRELERTRNRVEAILNNSSDAIILARFDGTISQTNPTFDDLFGYQPDELFGQSLTAVAHANSVGALQQAIRVVTTEGTIQRLEITAQCKNGTRFDAEVAMSLIRAATGQRGGIVCHLRDITERKRAESALRESEARYRELFEGIDDVIFVHDEEANILAVNDAACRRLGYTREELLSMKITDIDAPEYAASFHKRITKHRTLGGVKTHGSVHVTKDGQRIIVDVNSKIITYQGEPAILAVCRDITEQQRMEAALLESEIRYRGLFEHAPVALWESDFSGVKDHLDRLRAEGIDDFAAYFEANPNVVQACAACAHVLEVNQAALALFEIAHKGELEAMFTHQQQEGENRLFRDQLVALAEGMTRFETEEVFTTSTGRTLHTVVGLSIPPGSEKTWERILVYVTDITERKRAEEELRKALEKERELSELKTRFVSMASHEFRTPLTTIVSSMEILERYIDRMQPEQKEKHFRRIESASRQMTFLLDDVLLLGKAEAEQLHYDPAPVDLGQLAAEIVEDVQLTLPPALSIEMALEGSCKYVVLDKKLMRHIMTNLLSNAVKYSPQGGTVGFYVRCDDHETLIRVTDEGIGIPQKDLAHLFEPFHRAGNVNAIKGTGLGLAITKHAVDLHGGTIEVDSTVGAGTTFIVRIPVQAVEEQQGGLIGDQDSGD